MQLKRKDCQVASLAAVPCASSLVGRLTSPVAWEHFFFSILIIEGRHFIPFLVLFDLPSLFATRFLENRLLKALIAFWCFLFYSITDLGLAELPFSLLFM